MDALKEAVKLAGSQQALAEKIGGGQSRISQMFTRGRVAAEAVRPIAEAVGWQVTPHQLRPDLYPHPEDGLPETMRQRVQEEARAAE